MQWGVAVGRRCTWGNPQHASCEWARRRALSLGPAGRRRGCACGLLRRPGSWGGLVRATAAHGRSNRGAHARGIAGGEEGVGEGEGGGLGDGGTICRDAKEPGWRGFARCRLRRRVGRAGWGCKGLEAVIDLSRAWPLPGLMGKALADDAT